MFKFIDLFCGIGGFRIALEKYKLKCVFSCDIDKYASEVYYKNFGDQPDGDITKIKESRIPKHDILCAGFPCQSFSISGNQNGINDPRGRLFYEILRIAEYHKPSVMLLENVKNILTIDNGNAIKTIERELDKVGYLLHKHLLNSSFFGIPQARERVYFVAINKSKSNIFKYSTPKKSIKQVFLKDILEEDPEENLFIRREDIFIQKDEDNIDPALRPIRLGIVNKGGQGERIYSVKGHAITISAYGGGVGARTGLYKTNKGIRKLSINECKTLMGFSKTHIVSNGIQGYQQLGNAVIPDMISHVWSNIKYE